MLNRKNFTIVLATALFVTTAAYSQNLEQNWNDYLHYTKIGRLDLAAGYAQALLDDQPEPVELLALSEANLNGYAILIKVIDSAPQARLTELSKEILVLIERGRFIRRTEPRIIVAEVKRLSTTQRGRLAAIKRLKDAGEYTIMYMLDAIADDSRADELANILWALPKIGRDAIRPLAAGLQTTNIAVKAEIIKAMGQIGYPQSLAYLKYVIENDGSSELRSFAKKSIAQIDPAAAKLPAARMFYKLAEDYYYHAESLTPAEDADFANVWFWDTESERLASEKVDKDYFYELMSMRACEWALKADPAFGKAIGLWLAAFLKAESTGIAMPNYFGPGHADALVYATTAGPEYLHQALARAVRDKNAYVALGSIEALATIVGEKSLLYRIGPAQPLAKALSFDDRAVRYSAAIAIASANPTEDFAESKLVIKNLAEALGQNTQKNQKDMNVWSSQLADSYAVRSAEVMLELARTKNRITDLSAAQIELISATLDLRPEIQILSGQILAMLKSPNAQRAIARMALDENNLLEIRIAAFNSLITSAKFNANLLDVEMIDAIYSLVSSREIDTQLNSAAAAAFGSLNLPSEKVKNLILDQSRS